MGESWKHPALATGLCTYSTSTESESFFYRSITLLASAVCSSGIPGPGIEYLYVKALKALPPLRAIACLLFEPMKAPNLLQQEFST